MLRISIYCYFIVLLFYSANTLAQNEYNEGFQALYDSAKKYKSAEKGKLALGFALDKEEDEWIAKSYFLVGYYQEQSAVYYEALKNYFAALKHYKLAEDTRGQVKALINLANIYAKAGFFDKSLSFFEDAFALTDQSVEIKIQAKLNYSYAKALREIGNYEAAEKIYLEALDQFREIDDNLFVSYVYLDLGANNVFSERYEKARNYYSLAVDVFQEGSLEHENTLLKKINSFGYIAIVEDKLDSALDILQSGLQLASNVDQNREVFSEIYENLGKIYKDRNQVDSAVLMYAKSVDLGDFYAYDRNYIQTCEYLYRHYYENDDSRALDYHDTIYKFGDELATLQKQLNQEHIRYQVEAANYRREAELQYLAHQTERKISYAAYGFAVLLIGSLVYYFMRKEYLRAQRARKLLNSVKWH